MKFERLNELVEAIASAPDDGISVVMQATTREAFRLLAFLQSEQNAGSLTQDMQRRLVAVRTSFVKRLFANGAFYVIFSLLTKCQQEVGGTAVIAVDPEAGKYICNDLQAHRYRAVMRPVDSKELPAIIRGIAFNGFGRIRLYKSGCPAIEVPLASVLDLTDIPEGTDARFGMLSFLQELRRGIPIGELSAREKAMYAALNTASFFLPSLWEQAEQGGEVKKKMTHPCLQITKNGIQQNYMPVYTARAKLLGAPDYQKMCADGKNWGITQLDYKNMIRHCEHAGGALSGVVIDSADLSLLLSVEMLKIHCNI